MNVTPRILDNMIRNGDVVLVRPRLSKERKERETGGSLFDVFNDDVKVATVFCWTSNEITELKELVSK